MTIQSQNFEIHAGDTKQVIITVTDENDAILPLSGYDITWVMYRQTSKEEVLRKELGDGITVPTPSNGQIVIGFLPTDTADIVPNTYSHECEISSGPDDIATICTGTVKILYSKL